MPEQTSIRRISRTEIAMRVRGIIAEHSKATPTDCPEGADAADLGLDSLDVAEILMAVEESFLIDIFEAALANAGNIRELIDLVEGQVGGIA